MVGVDSISKFQRVKTSVNEQQLIPLAIFLDRNISILEALCEYLKEEYDISFAVIGRLTNRDERNIWTAYHRTKEKRKHRTPTTNTSRLVPLRAAS